MIIIDEKIFTKVDLIKDRSEGKGVTVGVGRKWGKDIRG
jgi:hypothetical protein